MIRLQTSGGRKSRLLFTLLLFMSFSSCFGQEPEPGYAVFNSETGTLTFQCDTPTGTYYSTDNTGTNSPGWNSKSASIKKVVFDSSFANARPTSCCYWFENCSNLTVIDGIKYLNTSKVTNMRGMFQQCSGLTSLTFGENFTTASCTSYGLIPMFYGCSRLRYLDFYASNDDNTHAFKEANLNRNGASSTVLFGKEGPGLPLTTVIYMPHDISKSDYTNYTDLPNLVFNDGGTLKAANYYSEDKVDIELPRKFKTTKAEYSRTMKAATQYGTVILPYEFTTNESVQAYLLRAEHTGTMWYEEVESVPAHTPFFYSKKTASDTNVNFNKTVANYGITVEATRTTSKAEGGKPYDAGSGMDGWTTKGYYITETVDASSGNTYYISGDKFWRATGTLKMYPHRVTYQGQWQYDLSLIHI